MQTFLPYASFVESVRCLDYRRLGKQRVEARQIHDIITGNAKSTAWRHHPAVLMWQQYEDSLASYMNCCISEWVKRGYKNSMSIIAIDSKQLELPPWFGLEEFHASHRSNLLRKDFAFYSRYGWIEEDSLPYYWPTKH